MLLKYTVILSMATALMSLSMTAQAKAPAENPQQKGLRIAKEGDDAAVLEAMEEVKTYFDEDLDLHFQHEERTIFAPIFKKYQEHIPMAKVRLYSSWSLFCCSIACSTCFSFLFVCFTAAVRAAMARR